jgi:hypothetical protein
VFGAARTVFEHKFDTVQPPGFIGQLLQRGQIHDEQIGWSSGLLGIVRNDSRDAQLHRMFVDDERQWRTDFQSVVFRQSFADENGKRILQHGRKTFFRIIRRVRSSGAEPAAAIVLLAVKIHQRGQVQAEHLKRRAREECLVFIPARWDGAAFQNRHDVDGFVAEQLAQLGQNGFRQVADGRGDEAVALRRDEVSEILKARDGSAIGEADGKKRSDAEGENHQQQQRRNWRQSPVTPREA